MSEEFTKRYYSIGEVAERFDVSKSLIRYWENQFSFLKPAKLSNGERRFTPENLEQFKLIYYLVKEKRFTIEGAKREIANNRAAYKSKLPVIERLREIRSGLVALQQRLKD